jgi:hypothetical protein
MAEDKTPRLCRNLRSDDLAIDKGSQWEEIVGPVVMIAEVEILFIPGDGDGHPRSEGAEGHPGHIEIAGRQLPIIPLLPI